MRHTEFDDLLVPYQDELLSNLAKFIAIDSVYDETTKDENNPFGKGVSEALNFIYELAIKDGFKATNYNNMVVEILLGEKEENVTILAHADVVPEGAGWSQEPFTLIENNGVLSARGVADDKGPLLAAYYAMKAIKDNNLLGDYQIRFIVGGNEESGSLWVEYYFNTLKKKQPTFGFSPDAEFPLIYAEKGIYTFKASGEIYLPEVISIKAGLAANSVIEECVLTLDKDSKFVEFLKDNTTFTYLSEIKDDVLVVTIKGVSAHGATPSLGKNAGVEALRLLALYLNDQKLIELFNKFLDLEGRGINAYCYSDYMECGSSMNVGIIEYENSNLSLVINYRYVDTCNIDKTKENIALAISPLKIITGGDSHLLFYEKTSTLVKTLLESYQEETGDYISKPMAIGGGTYAKEANNIIAFGSEFPGWNSNMHSIGESVKKSDLFKAASVYLRATLALGRKIDENKI